MLSGVGEPADRLQSKFLKDGGNGAGRKIFQLKSRVASGRREPAPKDSAVGARIVSRATLTFSRVAASFLGCTTPLAYCWHQPAKPEPVLLSICTFPRPSEAYRLHLRSPELLRHCLAILHPDARLAPRLARNHSRTARRYERSVLVCFGASRNAIAAWSPRASFPPTLHFRLFSNPSPTPPANII